MHILESYASIARAKISKPHLIPKFYPLVHEKYITIQGDSRYQSRQYNWFPEVLSILKPFLDKENIKVVQIGGSGDAIIPNIDVNLCGQTSFRQTFDVVRNALLHVGVDSLNVHIASVFGTKIVGLYSNMYIEHSKPYWSNPEDVRLIQAPLGERKPSYSQQDDPKIINYIKPEVIAKSVLELLNIEGSIERESIFFGKEFSSTSLESIPDCLVDPKFMPNALLHIRYDYVQENETTQKFLYNQIGLRKCAIYTDKLLNENALMQLRQNIVQIVVLITSADQLPIVQQVQKLGIPYALVSELSEEEINKLKIVYLDNTPIQKAKFSSKDKLPISYISDKTKFKTSKFILSQNKTYPSKAHWLSQKDCPISSESAIGEFIDSKDFWNEAEFYYLFNTLPAPKTS